MMSTLLQPADLAQDAYHIEYYVRQPDDRRLLSETDDLQATIYLRPIDCTLLLANTYDIESLE